MKKIVEAKKWITDRDINYGKAGNGPCYILCLPGSYGSWDSHYKEVLQEFDHEKFTIVAMDPPGYGKSRPPKRQFSVKQAKKDAIKGHKLMKALNLVPFSVIGYSEGARAAMHLAHEAKNTVKKLVVLSTKVSITESSAKLNEAICNLSNKPPEVQKRLVDVYGKLEITELLEEDAAFDWKVLREHNGALPAKDILKDIVQPTLVIRGENDWICEQEAMQYIADQIPNSRFLLCEGAGHPLHMEKKDWFRTVVQQFLLFT